MIFPYLFWSNSSDVHSTSDSPISLSHSESPRRSLTQFKSVFVGLLLTLISLILYLGGEFSSLKQGQNSSETQNFIFIPNVPGPEDMAIDFKHEFLYISSDPRRSVLKGGPELGEIYVINLQDLIPTPLPLTLLDEEKHLITQFFHPHGFDFLIHEGKGYLSIVNHHLGTLGALHGSQTIEKEIKHSIDVFEINSLSDPTTLTRVSQFTSPLLSSPNDVVALSPSEFYVTNDHGSTSKVGRLFETLTQRSWGSLLYGKQGHWKTAYEGIAFANGVEISADHKTVFVASANGDGLLVLEHSDPNKNVPQSQSQQEHGQLKQKERIKIQGALDNLSWNQEQTHLWLTLHPRPLRFLLHSKSPSIHSPTEVICLKWDLKNRGVSSFKTVLGKGMPVSGGSITVESHKALWVGNVFEEGIWKYVK